MRHGQNSSVHVRDRAGKHDATLVERPSLSWSLQLPARQVCLTHMRRVGSRIASPPNSRYRLEFESPPPFRLSLWMDIGRSETATRHPPGRRWDKPTRGFDMRCCELSFLRDETLSFLSQTDLCGELIDELRVNFGPDRQPMGAFKIAQGAPGSTVFCTVDLDWIAEFRQRGLGGADQARVGDDRFPAQEIADLVRHGPSRPRFAATQARGRQRR